MTTTGALLFGVVYLGGLWFGLALCRAAALGDRQAERARDTERREAA